MRQCSATKRDGSPCTLQAQGASGFCWAHDPANAAKRRQGQSRGGRSKPIADLSRLKAKLEALGDDVMSGKAQRANAAVAVTAFAAAIKCVEALVKVRELEESRLVETGLKVREQEQLIERLEALEEALAEKNGRRPWAG